MALLKRLPTIASDTLSPLQRVLLIVAASILLPAVIVVGLLFRESSLKQLEAVEQQAQQAADLIVLLADTRAKADITALRVLSVSRYFVAGDLIGGAGRARDTIDLVPGWKAVILSNLVTGEVAFRATENDTTLGDDGSRSVPKTLHEGGFGGVERDGPLCPCLSLQVPVRNLPDFVLTAIVDPFLYQNLLMERLPDGAVAAIVDQDGDFIARSLDYDERVGTPATEFVRGAVAEGGRGIYEGTTYEGFTNYTAYTVSETTGWSAHVAINNALIDRPRERANMAIIIGLLTAILIGAALSFYVVRDIAARRIEDRRLMEFQKAEAVNQFTATVVHDFRNVLSAVQSGLNMIIRSTKEPETEKYAGMIGDVLERGARLTNRLLSFVGDGGTEIEDIEINSFLDEIEYLLQQAAGQGVEVRIEAPTESARVKANRDQLELALVNLVVNARDAMSGKGLIDVSTAIDKKQVVISVADTGPGIPPEMRSKVFTRFFTTKPDGSGTGLGLSQVADMVREAGGSVSIEDANGGGAHFMLHLNRSSSEKKTGRKLRAA